MRRSNTAAPACLKASAVSCLGIHLLFSSTAGAQKLRPGSGEAMLRSSSANRPLSGAASVVEQIRSGAPCASAAWRAALPGGKHANRMSGIALPASLLPSHTLVHQRDEPYGAVLPSGAAILGQAQLIGCELTGQISLVSIEVWEPLGARRGTHQRGP